MLGRLASAASADASNSKPVYWVHRVHRVLWWHANGVRQCAQAWSRSRSARASIWCARAASSLCSTACSTTSSAPATACSSSRNSRASSTSSRTTSTCAVHLKSFPYCFSNIQLAYKEKEQSSQVALCRLFFFFGTSNWMFYISLRSTECFVFVHVLKNITFSLEMATGRATRGRAGPENPGPRALRAETGLMIFYLRFLCALCAGRWVVTRELCIVVTC